MKTTTTYQQLESRALPLMIGYREDLTRIDREEIERHPGIPFIHAVRATGTVLALMPAADSDYWPAPGETVPYMFGCAGRDHILAQIRQTAEYVVNPNNGPYLLYTYYDGKRLHRMGPERLVDVVTRYTRAVARLWGAARAARAAV